MVMKSHRRDLFLVIVVITHCSAGATGQAPVSTQSGTMVNPADNSTDTSPFAPAPSQSSMSSNSSDFVRHTKFVLPDQPENSTSGLDLAAGRTNAASVEAISQLQFVKTSGVQITVGGRTRYFKGSNDYFLVLR